MAEMDSTGNWRDGRAPDFAGAGRADCVSAQRNDRAPNAFSVAAPWNDWMERGEDDGALRDSHAAPAFSGTPERQEPAAATSLRTAEWSPRGFLLAPRGRETPGASAQTEAPAPAGLVQAVLTAGFMPPTAAQSRRDGSTVQVRPDIRAAPTATLPVVNVLRH